MSKIKIKERLENAVEGFFDNEKLSENTGLEVVSNASMGRVDESVSLAEKNRTLPSFLKQVFLFFPGTVFLFLLIFALTSVTVFLFLFSSGLTNVTGFNPIEAKFPNGSLPTILLLVVLSFAITWFGLGNLRKKEDICIPVSIVGTGMILGIISGLLSGVSYEMAELIFSESYPLYFFPIALIVPILAKGLVDNSAEKNSL